MNTECTHGNQYLVRYRYRLLIEITDLFRDLDSIVQHQVHEGIESRENSLNLATKVMK